MSQWLFSEMAVRKSLGKEVIFEWQREENYVKIKSKNLLDRGNNKGQLWGQLELTCPRKKKNSMTEAKVERER